ncbi:MAG: 2-amino-4-hydroxy-6-hydroxymethyldihydropteridine diphosphokinase [Bacteroidetes bacterium MedPE-SWsnd-G2]|nr:MAG: 2-amino-4-hydroxy-6-hydroxymethyldihydropteridine diphosphokinase [Bacteroidetes bacterium MedPE-SWsnd-G2]
MENCKSVFIGLGSNEGNSLRFLQMAVDALFDKIGEISAISKVYKTKSVGFDGPDFLNACVKVETSYSPEVLIEKILNIETELGRKRNDGQGYSSRCIDIDILYYESDIIDTPRLIVPHPHIHKRQFVLQPLKDIAAEVLHPVFEKTTTDLLVGCIDNSPVSLASSKLNHPADNIDISKFNYVAIEGNIGAGKTSLATQISKEFNGKLILERFADNPFLPKFYEDAQRYAFTLEMSFLADRYQQISDDLSQLDLFKDFIVSDYDVFKSLIFSKITLAPDEFKLYRKLFYLMYKDIAKPELYIYLYQNTERLQENIKRRGRSYEQNIENDYLEKINSGYLEFLKEQTALNVKIIDISEKDFVKNREDYTNLVKSICS